VIISDLNEEGGQETVKLIQKAMVRRSLLNPMSPNRKIVKLWYKRGWKNMVGSILPAIMPALAENRI